MKTCTKCGITKELSKFRKSTKVKSGLTAQCIECERAYRSAYYKATAEVSSMKHKEYYEKNRDKIPLQHKLSNEIRKPKRKEYKEKNAESIKKSNREYYEKNREAKLESGRKWREKNRDKIKQYYENSKEITKERTRAYVAKNKEEVKTKAKERANKPCTSKKVFNKIPLTDFPEFDGVNVTVNCKQCGARFIPTNYEVRRRIDAFNGTRTGDHNFYCSDACRNACPIFRANPNYKDPRLPKEKSFRACTGKHLKLVQCDNNENQSYCEKCGDFIDVDLHHTLPVKETSEKSINSSGHILLCWRCHAETHRECKNHESRKEI